MIDDRDIDATGDGEVLAFLRELERKSERVRIFAIVTLLFLAVANMVLLPVVISTLLRTQQLVVQEQRAGDARSAAIADAQQTVDRIESRLTRIDERLQLPALTAAPARDGTRPVASRQPTASRQATPRPSVRVTPRPVTPAPQGAPRPAPTPTPLVCVLGNCT